MTQYIDKSAVVAKIEEWRDNKKFYIKPVTENFPMILEDFTTNSVEYYKEYIDDCNDWGDSVIIDSDEEIDW